MAIYPCPAAEDDRQEPCSTAFAAVSGLDAVAGADNGSPGRGHGEAPGCLAGWAWLIGGDLPRVGPARVGRALKGQRPTRAPPW